MERLEINLEQGWTRKLRICFENKKESTQLKLNDYYRLKQCHSNKIIPLHKIKQNSELVEGDGIYVEGSALKKEKKGLLIKTADCAPLVFIDREQQKICLIHAGWRGLSQKIHHKPFTDWDFHPETTWAWLGPCLNGTNFECEKDLWESFPSEDQNNTETFAPTTKPEKRSFFVWNLLEEEFRKLGVELFYNVEVDTYSDKNFASYRRHCHQGGTSPVPQHNYTHISF